MAKFIKSAKDINNDLINDNIIEFCFIGRSNVGKSSVINALANEQIAKSSKTPGRTQLINLFDFSTFRLVDLPGYGFAKVSKTTQEDISYMMGQYLTNRVNLQCVFQVCDIRNIMPIDNEILQQIRSRFFNVYIILNKIDQVNKSFFDNNKSKIAKFLNIEIENLIPFSATKKINVALLKQTINNKVREIKKVN